MRIKDPARPSSSRINRVFSETDEMLVVHDELGGDFYKSGKQFHEIVVSVCMGIHQLYSVNSERSAAALNGPNEEAKGEAGTQKGNINSSYVTSSFNSPNIEMEFNEDQLEDGLVEVLPVLSDYKARVVSVSHDQFARLHAAAKVNQFDLSCSFSAKENADAIRKAYKRLTKDRIDQMFFQTEDDRFLIRIMPKERFHAFVSSVLPRYVLYLEENKHSLLTRIYQAFKIQTGDETHYALVIENYFAIDERLEMLFTYRFTHKNFEAGDSRVEHDNAASYESSGRSLIPSVVGTQTLRPKWNPAPKGNL